jgi:hypothetical protein
MLNTDMSIEEFKEQLKYSKLIVDEPTYDYYKGFYDGINSVKEIVGDAK